MRCKQYAGAGVGISAAPWQHTISQELYPHIPSLPFWENNESAVLEPPKEKSYEWILHCRNTREEVSESHRNKNSGVSHLLHGAKNVSLEAYSEESCYFWVSNSCVRKHTLFSLPVYKLRLYTALAFTVLSFTKEKKMPLSNPFPNCRIPCMNSSEIEIDRHQCDDNTTSNKNCNNKTNRIQWKL